MKDILKINALQNKSALYFVGTYFKLDIHITHKCRKTHDL